MNSILQIVLGGAAGALLRHLMAIQIRDAVKGSHFPWPHFIINLIGCLVIGILFALSYKWEFIEKYRYLLFAGLLGGYTTFSSFGLDVLQLWQNNQWQLAVSYVLGTNIAGILLVFAGVYLGKLFI